jgi:hypothetical protein
MNAKRNILAAGVLLALCLSSAVFVARGPLRDAYAVWRRGPVPPALTRAEIINARAEAEIAANEPAPAVNKPVKKKPPAVPEAPANAPKPVPTFTPIPDDIPQSMNLRIVFVPQAPFKVWDEVHEDTCEEAALVMLKSYLDGETTMTPEEMDRRLLAMVDWQTAEFGDYKSTDAEKTADILSRHLGVANVRILPLNGANDIRREIAAGRPVVLPTAGKLLMNPNFKNGGPLYHMLVVKGYDASGRFVTNDPGTRLGADYVYDEAVLMDAAHDWNGGDVLNGQRVMIVAE